MYFIRKMNQWQFNILLIGWGLQLPVTHTGGQLFHKKILLYSKLLVHRINDLIMAYGLYMIL